MKIKVFKNTLKKLFRLSNDHELVEQFLFPGARVFDFGCNDGIFFDRIKKITGPKLVGFDVNKKALGLARKKGYEVYNSLDKVKGVFDFIIANEVVEHLRIDTELPQFFKKSNSIISETGKIIVSTVNFNEFYNLVDFWNDPTHVRPLTIKSLKRLGINHGFRTIKVIKHHMRLNPRKILINMLLGMDIYAGYTIIFEKRR